MYVYSHKQSPMYNVNTEQDKKCRTERSYKKTILSYRMGQKLSSKLCSYIHQKVMDFTYFIFHKVV